MEEYCTYVIFGATGNLSRVKLMPALYHLEVAGKLPHGTRILALGRRDWNNERCIREVRERLKQKVRSEMDEKVFEAFARRIDYFQGDLADPAMYAGLRKHLADGAGVKRPSAAAD